MVLQVSFAQKKEENIGSEVVNVEPLHGCLQMLMLETPVLDDEGNAKRNH
jgi:hypothetical protein